MFRYLAEKAVENYPLDWDNDTMKEACLYRVEVLIATVFNLVIVALLAIIFSKEIECFIFFFVNSSLRLFSGGHHAKNHFNCIMTYITIMFLCIALADYLKGNTLILYGLFCVTTVFSIATNHLLSAKGDYLDQEDKITYHKRCMLILLVYLMLITCTCVFNIVVHTVSIFIKYCLFIMCFTLIMQSCSLIIEKYTKDK